MQFDAAVPDTHDLVTVCRSATPSPGGNEREEPAGGVGTVQRVRNELLLDIEIVVFRLATPTTQTAVRPL